MIKRYYWNPSAILIKDDNGELVKYEDYEADLAAAKIKLVEIDNENGELKEKLKLSRQDLAASKAELATLRVENERLTALVQAHQTYTPKEAIK
jgi:hypothetical protein